MIPSTPSVPSMKTTVNSKLLNALGLQLPHRTIPHQFLFTTIVLIAVVHGLLHVFLIPPWQHYDEPGHFEYAWLIAQRWQIPDPGDFEQHMRREVISTMVAHNFYENIGGPPNMLTDDEVLWLPFPQTDDPPLYYLLVAIALIPLRHTDIITQLYAARLVSCFLYLISILLAYGLVSDLLPRNRFLRLTVAGFMALLPAYTDLMTSVNNDVGAVVVFSFFLWGCTRLLMQGLSIVNAIWVVPAAGLCLWTKNTVFVALPLLALVTLMTLLRQWWNRNVLFIFVGTCAVALLTIFDLGEARYWYCYPYQLIPLRQQMLDAPVGKGVLAVEIDPENARRAAFHFLLPETVKHLQGKEVTLGVWMWASKPTTIRPPILSGAISKEGINIDIGIEPSFHAFPFQMASDRVFLFLEPYTDQQERVIIFYDGLVLAEGKRPLDSPPQFDNPNGTTGIWGEQRFVNLIRNPSFEESSPGIRQWVAQLLYRLVSRVTFRPEENIAAVLDWERTSYIYPITIRVLVTSFWAVFGWGHVLIGGLWYEISIWLTVIGVIGAIAQIIRSMSKTLSPPTCWAMLFLGIAMVVVWVVTLLRPLPLYPWDRTFIPVARYAYPVIIPTSLALVAGWTAWPWQNMKRWSTVTLFIWLFILNGVSLWRIVSFW